MYVICLEKLIITLCVKYLCNAEHNDTVSVVYPAVAAVGSHNDWQIPNRL